MKLLPDRFNSAVTPHYDVITDCGEVAAWHDPGFDAYGYYWCPDCGKRAICSADCKDYGQPLKAAINRAREMRSEEVRCLRCRETNPRSQGTKPEIDVDDPSNQPPDRIELNGDRK